jgi:putative transcriptional regulator
MGDLPPLKNTIKLQRARKDWTQEELARRIGVTRKTINTIENGIHVPSTVLALRMARVFGVAVEEIFQLAEAFPAGNQEEV